jgi:arylsulfatase A-like enzyme
VSWLYVGPLFGFDRGFERYLSLVDRERIEFASGGGARRAEQVTDVAIRFLEAPHTGPFFLFLHYFDPHMDYAPPAPYDTLYDPDYDGPADGSYAFARPYIDHVQSDARDVAARDRLHMQARYDGEIRYVDAQLERLFAALEASVGLDSSLVVLLSDHGEEFDDHGSMEGHGFTHYEEVLHVPLILRLPGRQHAGRVVSEPVELLDVAPTVLDLVGVPAPAAFQGRSLARFWNGSPPVDAPAMAYAETEHYGLSIRSLRGARFKLIQTSGEPRNAFGAPIRSGYELYDLTGDPDEQSDLWPDQRDAAQPLLSRLEALAPAAPAEPLEEVELPEIDAELLRRLGYAR